jgi:peptidyl-prolyl cis-trans isomerase C
VEVCYFSAMPVHRSFPHQPFARIASFAAVGFLAALSSCKKGKTDGSDKSDSSPVIAVVGDSKITVNDVNDRLNSQSPFARARFAVPEKKKELVEDMVRFELIAAEAQKKGFDKDPDVVRAMKQQMITKYLEKDLDAKLKPDDVPDADVEKYYADHSDEFNKKAEVRVSEIVVADKAKADKVYTEAKALGETPATGPRAFHDLVAKYSEDADSKQRGGDTMPFDHDSTAYPKPVVDAAFALPDVGAVSPPVQTDKGWAILKLLQKRPDVHRSLAEAKHDIQQKLFRETRTKALDSLVADLKKDKKIEVHEENFDKIVVGNIPNDAMHRAPGPDMHGAMSPMTPAPAITMTPVPH